jgi:hypothetical protein
VACSSSPPGGRSKTEPKSKREKAFPRICGFKITARARLRLDRRALPPAFTIASPQYNEGEAMVKAGGTARVHSGNGMVSRRQTQRAVARELVGFVWATAPREVAMAK